MTDHMRLVIDTSVFVSSIQPEISHQLCLDLLRAVYPCTDKVQIFEPFLLGYEFLLSVSKGSKLGSIPPREAEARLEKAQVMLDAFLERPGAEFVALGAEHFSSWRSSAKSNRYETNSKTQDDIFLSLSVEKGACLVTLDENKRKAPKCTAGVAIISSPYEILEELRAIKM